MIHGKQFAILPAPLEGEDYRHFPLADGMVLSCSPGLPAALSPDGRNVLLGHAWSALEDGLDPAQAIETLDDPARLLREECAWCGRYVLIADGKVYTDTAATMPVFYSDEGVASDILFLVEAGAHPRNGLRLEGKVKWFPGPATAFEGVSRLLPSQCYHYREKTLTFRATLSPDIPEGLPYEELRERCVRLLRAAAVNMHRHFRGEKIIVALTGGYDSRLSFAALESLGDDYPFSAYTLEHEHISAEDRDRPRALCERCSVPYFYGRREPEKFSERRYQDYSEHLSGMVLEEDQLFYAYGQYDGLLNAGEKGVLVRSNIYTVTYASAAQTHAVGKTVDSDDFFAHYEISPRSPMARAFQVYFDWTAAHPLPFSDTHRFYWEQKMACWSAEDDRGYDIYEQFTAIQLSNCRDLVTLLMYMPEERKKGKAHQAEMIAALCPQIADIPYGSGQGGASGKLKSLAQSVGKAWRKMQKIGFARGIQYYLRKITHR